MSNARDNNYKRKSDRTMTINLIHTFLKFLSLKTQYVKRIIYSEYIKIYYLNNNSISSVDQKTYKLTFLKMCSHCF